MHDVARTTERHARRINPAQGCMFDLKLLLQFIAGLRSTATNYSPVSIPIYMHGQKVSKPLAHITLGIFIHKTHLASGKSVQLQHHDNVSSESFNVASIPRHAKPDNCLTFMRRNEKFIKRHPYVFRLAQNPKYFLTHSQFIIQQLNNCLKANCWQI